MEEKRKENEVSDGKEREGKRKWRKEVNNGEGNEKEKRECKQSKERAKEEKEKRGIEKRKRSVMEKRENILEKEGEESKRERKEIEK